MEEKTQQNLNLAFVSLFNDLSSEVISRVLPLYLLLVIQTSFFGIGVVESIAESTATLGRLFSGYYSDRRSKRKPLIFLGYALSVASRPLILLQPTLGMASLARFIEKIGKSIRTPPRDALIADLSTIENRGRNFGINRALDTLGAVLGLLSVYVFLQFRELSDRVALKTILEWACAEGVIALVVLWILVEEPLRENTFKAKSYSLSWISLDDRMRFYLLIGFFFALASSSDAFLIARGKDLGFSIKDIFLILAGFNIVSALAAFPAARLSDRFGRKAFLLAGWGIYAFAYLFFGAMKSSGPFVVIFLVYGLFYALTDGVEKAMVADFEKPETKGQAYGWLGLIQGLAVIPANLIFASVYMKAGGQWAFWSSSLFAFLGILLLIFFDPRRTDTTPKVQI